MLSFNEWHENENSSERSELYIMTNTPAKGRTIHIHRDQWHLAWDHSITPIARIQSGEMVSFDLLDASCGQIVHNSTVEAIRTLDFSQVDQVNGPIYVEGAAPGDTLEVEFLDLQPADWGWTAIIPGFGLLADEFPEMGHKSPTTLGGSPVSIMIYVADVDSVFKKAISAGGKEQRPVKDQFYGDRSGSFEDPFGIEWHVTTHIEDISPEEMERRATAAVQAAS